MSNIKIWIHAIWETKNRNPLLTIPIRKVLLQHILEYASGKGIQIEAINGHTEHVHCLFSLPSIFSCAEVMQILMDESSFWLNKNFKLPTKLEWTDDYIAVSISESMKDAMKSYILNQKDYHQKKVYAEEYDEIILKYGFQKL
jgi:REP element-mobilizing transposase RayT